MRTLPTREYERLERALARSELVVCLGPGVSEAAGFPTRAGLVRALVAQAQVLGVPSGAGRLTAIEEELKRGSDYVGLLDDLERALGEESMHAALTDVLKDNGHVAPSHEPLDLERAHDEAKAGGRPPLFDALVRLARRLHLVVDTSLDDLVLRALEGAGWLGHWAIGPSSALQARRVVKVCGGLSGARTQARFTSSDLLRAAAESRLRAFGTALLRGRVVLFVGFRANDRLLDWLFQLAPDHGQPTDEGPLHVALVPPAKTARRDRERWAARGLSLCTIGDSNDDHTGAVAQLLNQLAGGLHDPAQRGKDVAVKGDGTSPMSPYPGLELFDEDRAAYFFGREVDIDAVLSAVADDGEGRRWISIEGPSGVGKSSFVRAGLVAAIRRGQLGGSWAERSWTVGVCRPGRRPFTRLVEVLETEFGRSLGSGGDFAGTKDAILKVTRERGGRGDALLLTIDQLEEALTFGEPQEREHLAEVLVALLREPSLPVLVVTTIRSDHLAALRQTMPALWSLLNTHALRYDLPSLSEAGLRAAIVRPARACGLALEGALVERLLGDAEAIEHQAGAIEDAGPTWDRAPADRLTSSRALPLVAHVLRELWQRRHAGRITCDDYEQLGGIARALTQSADKLLHGLDEALRLDTDNLLLGLVAPIRGNASGYSRKTLVLDEAVRLAGGGSRGLAILARLSGSGPEHGSAREGEANAPKVRLVATRESNGVTHVDLVHEALLHSWKHMADLLSQRGAERVRTDDLEREAARWVESKEARAWLPVGGRLEALLEAAPESDQGREFRTALVRHRATRMWLRRILLGVVVTVAVLLGVLSFVAVSRGWAVEVERDNVARERDKAQVRLDQAIKLTKVILWEVLPKLEAHPEVRAEAKEILELLQRMLRELGITKDDADARRAELVAHHKRGDEALHTDNIDVARTEYAAGLAIAEALATAAPRSVEARRDVSVSLEKIGDIEVQASDLAKARDFFSRSLAIKEELVKASPHSAQAKRDLSIAIEKLGSVVVLAGDLAKARNLFSRSLTIKEELTTSAPHSSQAKRDLAKALERLGDIEVRAGDLAKARDAFSRSLAITEQLNEADPHSAQAKREVSFSLNYLGDVEVRAGDLTKARNYFSRSLSIREELAIEDMHSALARRDLSVSLTHLGDVEVKAGDLAKARDLFSRSLTLKEELATTDPHSARAKRDLSVSLERLGWVEINAGNLAKARDFFSRSLEIAEELVRADPHSAEAKHDLFLSVNMLGSIEDHAGDHAKARDLFARALTLSEELTNADPHSARARRSLSIALSKTGDSEVAAGDLAKARDAFSRSLSIMEELNEADPHSAQAKRDLSIVLKKLGDIELEAGDLARAREVFSRALAIAEELATADPHSAETKHDLSGALIGLGDVEDQAGDLAKARDLFARALKIAEGLAEADLNSAEAKRDLSVSLIWLGDVELQAGDLAKARDLFARALKIAEGLAEADPHSAQAKNDVSIALRSLGDVQLQAGDLARAHDLFSRALILRQELAKENPHSARAKRGLAVTLNKLGEVEAQAGHHAKARALASRSLDLREELAEADPHSALSSFDVVLTLISLSQVAAAENDDRALKKFLHAADERIDAMTAKGHVDGHAQREALRDQVKKTVKGLPPG